MNHRHAFSKSSRCQFRTASGKRCRFNASDTDSNFCDQHAGVAEKRREADDLSAVLTSGLTQFRSAAELNDFLARLLLLLAQDRISARRAAVLAYIANLLLRTVGVLDEKAEAEAAAEAQKQRLALWSSPLPRCADAPVTNAPPLPRTTSSVPS